MGRRSHNHSLTSAIGLGLVGLLWLLLAPAQLGGPMSYIIVSGNSMEPTMRQDDLALVRRAEQYGLGDIAVYRHPQLGPVIHRIIAVADGRFSFKGDNNAFVDAYQPDRAELLGVLWLHVPVVGKGLRWLRQPVVFALLVATISGVLFMPYLTQTDRRRLMAWRPAPARPSERIVVMQMALLGCAVLGILSLGLAIAAFSQAPARRVPADIDYDLAGSFGYRAATPAGGFPAQAALPGDPIYRRLTTTLPVSFTARLNSVAPASLGGVGQLLAEVGDAVGWRQIIALGEPIAFQGHTVALSGTLDLAQVQEAIDSFERQTGIRNSQYSLTIAPSVAYSGALGGAPFEHTFAPQLRLVLDADRIRPVGDRSAMQVAAAGSLPRTAIEPARLQLWVFELDVTSARRMALIGGELALIGGLIVAWLARRMVRSGGEAMSIELHYGGLLVNLDAPLAWMEGATPVASIADLARLAERLGQPMLYLAATQCAFVRNADHVYMYCGSAPLTAQLREA